jgi:hypothetical protein
MATIHNEKYQRRAIAIAIALCASVALRVVAQDPKGLNIDVANCVTFEKPEDRLACFEAQVEAARQRTAPAAASDTTAAAAATATATAAATTGASIAAKAAGTDAAERIAPSTAAAEPVAPGTAAAGPSQKSASEPRFAESRSSVERSPEREPVELVATVVELRQTVPNAYVITLDNGQVYRQVHPMPYPLRTGLVVVVRETNFGLRLTAPELHGQINVERVR